jgi:hypothetical protein
LFDRLRRELARVDALRVVIHPFADMLDAEAPERDRLECRQEPLASVDLIPLPGARLEVRPAPGEPALPERSEGLARMTHLAALDLLGQAALRRAGGALAREPAPGRLLAGAVAGLEVPARAGLRGVRIDTGSSGGSRAPALARTDLLQSGVEDTRELLAREALAALAADAVAPANDPAAAIGVDAHHTVAGVFTRVFTVLT